MGNNRYNLSKFHEPSGIEFTFEDNSFQVSKVGSIELKNCDFLNNTKFADVAFHGTNLHQTQFDQCQFSDVKWHGVSIKDSSFENCKIEDCQLMDFKLMNCKFKNLNLRDIKISKIHLENKEFNSTEEFLKILKAKN